MGAIAILAGYLPAIIETIGTGAKLLSDWQALNAKANSAAGVTGAELAAFAADMEAALSASQAALRGTA